MIGEIHYKISYAICDLGWYPKHERSVQGLPAARLCTKLRSRSTFVQALLVWSFCTLHRIFVLSREIAWDEPTNIHSMYNTGDFGRMFVEQFGHPDFRRSPNFARGPYCQQCFCPKTAGKAGDFLPTFKTHFVMRRNWRRRIWQGKKSSNKACEINPLCKSRALIAVFSVF